MKKLKTDNCIICGAKAVKWDAQIIGKKEKMFGYADLKVVRGFCKEHSKMMNENTEMFSEISKRKLTNWMIAYEDRNGNFIHIGVNHTPASRDSFMISDFTSMFPGVPFIEIVEIYVKKTDRHKGIGSKLIKKVVDDYKNYVILTTPGVSKMEYPIEPSYDSKIDIIESLSYFYNKNGFVDVNDYIGQYEFKRSYIYGESDIGKKVIKTIYGEYHEKE